MSSTSMAARATNSNLVRRSASRGLRLRRDLPLNPYDRGTLYYGGALEEDTLIDMENQILGPVPFFVPR
jgi:hypothetical protein